MFLLTPYRFRGYLRTKKWPARISQPQWTRTIPYGGGSFGQVASARQIAWRQADAFFKRWTVANHWSGARGCWGRSYSTRQQSLKKAAKHSKNEQDWSRFDDSLWYRFVPSHRKSMLSTCRNGHRPIRSPQPGAESHLPTIATSGRELLNSRSHLTVDMK